MITFREQALEIISQLYPFCKLPEDLQMEIVDMNPIRRVKKGKTIYELGDEAAALYIVIQGTVGLNDVFDDGTFRPEMAINAGEMFGFETIQEETFQNQAVAWSDCLLLELSYDFLESAASVDAIFKKSVLFLSNCLMRSSHTHFPWRNLEENILYANRRHWMVLLLKLILPIFLLLALIPLATYLVASQTAYVTPLMVTTIGLVIIAGYSLWVVQDWRNDYAVITNQRVVWQEKVILLYESRQEAPLDSVLAISVNTSMLGRMFSYGNVIVRTYAGIIDLNQVPSPEEVAAMLESQWQQAKRGTVRAEQFARVEQMIKERLFHTAETTQIPAIEDVKPEQVYHPQRRGLFDWLADVFQLRLDSQGMVRYRTHWWILLKRIFFPGLVTLLLLIGVILNLLNIFSLLTLNTLLLLTGLLGTLCIFWLVYEYVDWRNDIYIVTHEFLIDVNKKPLGLENKKTAPLSTIQSVEFERIGLPGLLLNFGTVSIRVGETTLTFDNVYNPAEVQRDLFKTISERERKRKDRAVAEEEQRLTDWIEVYHHLSEKEDKDFTENI
ncbi:MAG: cyclic nucleotide-binding domain-containing protein [Anaerolineaceae bacterium]|nr:cyclic nucleotide-binding domain-containing protein [Anaerolineaceae bacterium]